MSDNDFVVGSYLIRERLGAGAMGAVYRATHNLTGQDVALKRVSIESLDAGSSGREEPGIALMSEFQTLASLHHPNIVRVLDYGVASTGQLFFAMELLGEARTIVQAAAAADTSGKIRLIGQLLQALMYLHRRKILHRDIKPNNVLAVGGDVKVLDFGLATETESSQRLAGTLAYMAPEVVTGGPPTLHSDLFSVGVLAFEMFYGAFPFDLAAISDYARAKFQSSAGPDASMRTPHLALRAHTVQDAALSSMMATQAALVTAPAAPGSSDASQALWHNKRSMPATGVVGELIDRLLAMDPAARYVDPAAVFEHLCQLSGEPLKQQNVLTRESFLQAARLVGRSTEIGQLTDALHRALRGEGSAWLVGGESGVGKSRLVDEPRIVAMVRGALVVRGQAATEGGNSFALWREPLRALCVHAPIRGEDAAVLRDLVEDIEQLLSRPVPAAVALPPQAAQARLFASIAQVVQHVPQPLLLMFEDLQWADADSLSVLRHLLDTLPQLPVMVLGNFRDDERPDLPAGLPSAHVLKLSRLGLEGTANLCESILGREGTDPNFVAFLPRNRRQRFFMVEVLRTLAEQTGDLHSVARGVLPETVLTGGMRRLVARRLDFISDSDKKLLRFAAVAGRSLDKRLLQALAAEPIDTWLRTCANAAILDTQAGEWRFSHDKLRETILADLAPAGVARMHGQVGAALESLYTENLDRYAARLAYHWEVAGEPAKAAQYYIQAGELAERLFAHAAARLHYQGALRALENLPDGPTVRRRRVDVVALYANISWSADPPDQMLARLRAAVTLLESMKGPEGFADEDRRRQARLELWIGRILHARGKQGAAIVCYRNVLTMAQSLGDEDLIGLPSMTIGQAYMTQGYWGEYKYVEQGLDYVLQHASEFEQVRAIGYMSVGMSSRLRLLEAEKYAEQSLNKALGMNNDRAVGFAAIYFALAKLTGQDYTGMAEKAALVTRGATKSGDRIIEFIGHGLTARALIRQHNLVGATDSLNRARKLRQELSTQGGRLLLADWFDGAEAEIIFEGGDMAATLAYAERLVKRATQQDEPMARGLAERVWGRALGNQSPCPWAAAQEHLAQSVRVFEGAGVQMEAAITHVYWAQLAARQGHEDIAQSMWRRAVDRYELAGLAPPPHPLGDAK